MDRLLTTTEQPRTTSVTTEQPPKTTATPEQPGRTTATKEKNSMTTATMEQQSMTTVTSKQPHTITATTEKLHTTPAFIEPSPRTTSNTEQRHSTTKTWTQPLPTTTSTTKTLPETTYTMESPETTSLLDRRLQDITDQRKRAREAQPVQGKRMVKRSRIDLKEGEAGDNVAEPIPMVDAGRGDPRNILGVIADQDENDMYIIAVKADVLKGKYTRTQFDLCSQSMLTDNDADMDCTTTIRQAVKSAASGGQGFFRCNCNSVK